MSEAVFPQIIHPASLAAQVHEDFLLIEVGNGEKERYLREHIPGAIYLDTNSFEHAPQWNILPPQIIETVLLSHGITAEKTVILYGSDHLAVARTALVLMYAGVKDVRRMDGGIQTWKASSYPLATGANDPLPAGVFGQRIPVHPEYIININQVRDMLVDPNAAVVCVRTWDEYTGKISGYSYIQAKGHIPGSVWAGEIHPGPPAAGQDDLEQRTLQACREIASRWRASGITPDKRIAFYCGTGWRASEAFWYARMMGWGNASIFDGGWLEWSSQADNPIETAADNKPQGFQREHKPDSLTGTSRD